MFIHQTWTAQSALFRMPPEGAFHAFRTFHGGTVWEFSLPCLSELLCCVWAMQESICHNRMSHCHNESGTDVQEAHGSLAPHVDVAGIKA